MNILSLSTAEQGASLAVFDGKALICESYWTSRLTHSRRLISMIENLVADRAGLTLEDVDGFVAARGPGSFTGLRIGISVIKGLAYALSKPCIGISSLDGIAWRFSHCSQPVCVMMDARRSQVYSATFEFSKGELVKKSEEVVESAQTILEIMAPAGDVLFAGSGTKAYRDIILDKMGGRALFSVPAMDYVSAAALAGPVLCDNTAFSDPDRSLTPTYIRKSDAEINLATKTGN